MSESGKDEAFRLEFPVLYRRAYQAAYRLCGDRGVAEELAQEALTRAYLHWDRLDQRREGWVVTAVVRLAIGRWRRVQRRAATSSAPVEAPLDTLVAQRLDLMRLLAALPKRQREVAVLRYLEDRSESEVAAMLGCSVGTVKRHASRAMSRLRTAVTLPPATPNTEVP